MAFTPASPADSPRELVATVRNLTRQVRVAQRGTWFPLLVLAAVTLAAAPVYRFAPRHLGPCRDGAGAHSVCAGYIPAVLIFWPLALVLAYALIARFYVSQARRRGVGTRVRPYVITGAVLAGALAAASWWRATHPLPLPNTGDASAAHPHLTLLSFATPATAIGLALLVLAWVEANRLLLAFSVVFLGTVLAQAGAVIHSASRWYFLPQLLIPAALLLLGSGGFALLRPAQPKP
ncbi:MAG: hypothetical protein JWP11_2772 [Frankiales bacterium]|nr:hypothetical protein [Frankiales bacterium]